MTQQQAVLLCDTDLPRAERGNGAITPRLVLLACSSQSMINGITTIPPHGAIHPNHHNCEERVLMLSGAGIVVVGEIKLALKTGDFTWIPANLPHQFRNGSDTDNLRIFWTYTLSGATRTMVDTGETNLIDLDHEA